MNKGLIESYGPEILITWLVGDSKHKIFFSYNKNVELVETVDDFKPQGYYDKFIPLFVPAEEEFLKPNSPYKKLSSFYKYWTILAGQKHTSLSLFQVYYALAGITWHGQGYDITYYPKTKSKNNRIGIAISNAKLRNYVSDKLVVPYTPYYVPYKENIYRKLDEINKCKQIVTDDELTMNLALYLRKYVYFLKTIPMNMRIEMFNHGEIFNVPSDLLR